MRLSIIFISALPIVFAAATPLTLTSPADRSIMGALNGLELLSNIYGHDMFSNPNAANIPTYIKDAMGFVQSFMDLFTGGNENTIKQRQESYFRMEASLARIESGLQSLKDLVQWTSTLSAYQDSETAINNINSNYESLLKATNSRDRNTRSTRLRGRCDAFYYLDHPTTLVQGITRDRHIGASKSLSRAIRDNTNDDRRKVNHFLLGVARIAKRGADIQIACAKLLFPNDASQVREEERIQKRDMENMMKAIREVDRKIREGEYRALLKQTRLESPLNTPVVKIREDIRAEWRKHIGQSNQNVASRVFNFIMQRWYDYRWMVIVHGHRDRNTHWYYNYKTTGRGQVILRDRHGDSVILVARVPLSNSINIGHANELIKLLDSQSLRFSNALEYVNGMSGIVNAAVYYVAKEMSNVGQMGASAQGRMTPGMYEDDSDFCWGRCPSFQGIVFG